ncbi:MAG: hypothetical protein IJL50_01000 [Bacteroidaceae bacterium]|nr:hypothetical protein [Bacteroidaceae bacterium]
MKTPKDTDLREALRRKYAREPQLPANFTSRMMSQKKRRWLLPASALAIAASVLLLIIFNIEKPQPEQQTPVIAEKVMPPVPVISDEPVEHANPAKPIIPVKVAKAATPKKQLAEAELPDTLGQSIFESEENVRIAMQILCECEATIRQEKQQTRNYIIEATFNALPQAENALLVTNENGDFEVIEVSEQTAIEI